MTRIEGLLFRGEKFFFVKEAHLSGVRCAKMGKRFGPNPIARAPMKANFWMVIIVVPNDRLSEPDPEFRVAADFLKNISPGFLIFHQSHPPSEVTFHGRIYHTADCG